MRDFKTYALGLSGIARYFGMDEYLGEAMIDSGPYAVNGAYNSYVSPYPPFQQPGYLLDQHRPTMSYAFTGGHGQNSYNSYAYGLSSGGNPNNQSWSLVFAGLKPHDMSVARQWHWASQTSGASAGMDFIINANGSISVTSVAGTTMSSSAGLIKQYQSHLVIISYDNTAGYMTVYVGDWTGAWATAISSTASPMTAYPDGTVQLGGAPSGTATADGFLDEFAAYVGHAITSTEATRLFNQSGFQNGVTYPVTKSHRHSVFNQAWPANQTLDANSAAAGAELAAQATPGATFASGTITTPSYGGTFNFNQNDVPIYVVDTTLRFNSSELTNLGGPTHYGWIGLTMQFEDAPAPYDARPSLGFRPCGMNSDGVTETSADHTLCIWCPDTDEYWECYQISNGGTEAAPVWSTVYGQKLTQFSLNYAKAPNTTQGDRACGIPSICGISTIAELQAAQTGAPIPHAIVTNVGADATNWVWPAMRTDGVKATSYPVKQGQVYRFPASPDVSSAIAAMTHPTGRAIATAIQQYGLVVADGSTCLVMQTEDYWQFDVVNGYDAYHYDAFGNAANGILNGETYAQDTMAGCPWSYLELLSTPALNPTDASQAVRPAVTGINSQRQSSSVSLSWTDDPLTEYWNVYVKTAPSTYTLLAQTWWPGYTVWYPASTQTYAITAVNGGGESSRSADFTPPATPRSRRRPRMVIR